MSSSKNTKPESCNDLNDPSQQITQNQGPWGQFMHPSQRVPAAEMASPAQATMTPNPKNQASPNQVPWGQFMPPPQRAPPAYTGFPTAGMTPPAQMMMNPNPTLMAPYGSGMRPQPGFTVTPPNMMNPYGYVQPSAPGQSFDGPCSDPNCPRCRGGGFQQQ